MSMFDMVRQSCHNVIDNARYVSLDLNRIGVYRDMYAVHRGERLQHSAEEHLLGSGLDTLAFFLVLDTINFGSGFFPHIKKAGGASGYFTIASHLKKWFLSNGVPPAEQLPHLTTEDCGRIFNQDTSYGTPSRELMVLFAKALNDLGEVLLVGYDGDYRSFLCQPESAEALVTQVLEMPMFKDVSRTDEGEVWFLKRAQILVQDLYVAEPEHDMMNFADIDQLTAFADNVLPYALRCDGVLELDQELEQRIEREVELEPQSREEIELRAAAVVAVEAIARDLTTFYGENVAARNVDFMMWGRGQQHKRVFTKKRHRTRCVFY